MGISKAEQSFIKASILNSPPSRADGRKLEEFRPIAIQTQSTGGGDVAPLANGSAKVDLGGSEVIAAIKLEAEDVPSQSGATVMGGEEPLGRDGGRVVCTVSCSQSAYPTKTSNQLDDLSSDLSTLLTSSLSSCLTPSSQLTIVPSKKSWALHIDALVLADRGNIFDAIVIAIRAALWDLRIPRTRTIEVEKVSKEGEGEKGKDGDTMMGMKALLKQRVSRRPVGGGAEFDLEDYWDEGECLRNRDALPIGMTMNLIPPYSFLDASTLEEESVLDRLHMVVSFMSPSKGTLHGFQLSGPGEVPFTRLQPLLNDGERYASLLSSAVGTMLSNLEAQAKNRSTIGGRINR